MKKGDDLINSAFKKIIINEKNKKNFDDVINGSFDINDEHMNYDEIGEIIEREFVGDTRENTAIKMLTINIVRTYKKCKNHFSFEEAMKPRRELTSPSEGVYNEGRDNNEYNLIICVQDEIRSPNYTYVIEDLVGQGISGQVFKCFRKEDQKYFAMKIIKNKKAYKNAALIELRILELLNNEVDKQDLHHIIRLYDHFCYREHLCIIFELLNENLFELLKQNYFQGISLNSIRFIIKQILEAIYQIHRANLIHCDLKPENVLLKIDKCNNKNDIIIKITDFGSSCFKNNTMFQYIQSRYYRAPEVLIGTRYGSGIDMWSIGCIAAELYLGEPILPGSCEFDQLNKIVKLLGDIPYSMIREGKNSKKFYTIDKELKVFKIKTVEEYYKENPNDMESRYEIPMNLKHLDELVYKNNKKHNTSSSSDINNSDLESFVNLLKGLLNPNPLQRWNAKQALKHPFITKEKFEGFYNPYAEEISQFICPSIEGSYSHISEYQYNNIPMCVNKRVNNNQNQNMHHSMIYNTKPPYMSNNNSFNNSILSNTNSSFENSCYQLNTKMIPFNMLKKFPYAKIDGIDFKKESVKRKKYHNKFDNYNTFMKTSYDEIYFNNSFTGNYNFNNQIQRELKDNFFKSKNKFSKFSNNEFSKIHTNNNEGTVYNMTNLLHVQSSNKSQFITKEKNNFNLKEYEDLMSKSRDFNNNRSFDFQNRTRSRSDYNENNFNVNYGKTNFYTNNNLNFSNFSTYEKENFNKKIPSKQLSSKETPIVNSKLIQKTDEKEIKEEDHTEEELISINKI